MKNRISNILVLLLTLFMIYLVFRNVNLEELFSTLRQADLSMVAISITLAPILVMLGAIKWQILLRSDGIRISLGRLFALYLVGRFFNNFLPTTVGGDVVRAYELGNYTRNSVAVIASVFMERFSGFILLVVMAVVSFFTQIRLVQEPRLTLIIAVAVLGLLGILWLILDSRPVDLAIRHLPFPFVQKYLFKLQKLRVSISAYRTRRKTLALALFWSLMFMIGAILNVYISARAFHKPISLIEIAVIVPVILVVAMMPLTFNGLGTQEWAYMILFSWIGLPASVGLSTILLIRAKDLVMAAIGGLIYPAIRISKDDSLPVNSGIEEVRR